MRMRNGVVVVTLAAGVAAGAACGRSETPAETAKPVEPLFKPIDPSQVPAAPGAAASAPTMPALGGAPGTLQPVAMVTDMASGWPVNLAIGQEMTARLTSDASGGRWALRPGTDGGVMALQGAPASEASPGQPAAEVFRLKAVKPGNASLTFDLRKGPEAAPLKSVSYPVTVQ